MALTTAREMWCSRAASIMRRLQRADCHRLCGADAEASAAAAAGRRRDFRRRRTAEPRMEANRALGAGVPAGLAVDTPRREAGLVDGGHMARGSPSPGLGRATVRGGGYQYGESLGMSVS